MSIQARVRCQPVVVLYVIESRVEGSQILCILGWLVRGKGCAVTASGGQEGVHAKHCLCGGRTVLVDCGSVSAAALSRLMCRSKRVTDFII